MSCRRLAVAFLLFPLALSAQASATPQALASPIHAVNRTARQAPICDGSAIRSAKHRAYLGLAMMGASIPVSLIGMYKTVHSTNHPEGPVATGLAAGTALVTTGFIVAGTANPRESFWEGMIARMKTGETRSADVRTCLDRPAARTSTDSLEEWTYITSHGSRIKSVSLTFRDSVLVGIKRAEVTAALAEHSTDPVAMPVIVPPVIPAPIPPVIPPPRR